MCANKSWGTGHQNGVFYRCWKVTENYKGKYPETVAITSNRMENYPFANHICYKYIRFVV